MKYKFTLIELIVVIAVLGILAAIIVPNISNMQGKATEAAIAANTKAFQTSVDMFSLENNGSLPTGLDQPTVGVPQILNLTQLNPDYLRNSPKTKGVLYWVDYTGAVWSSTVDSPTNVENNGGTVSWTDITGASSYNVYEIQSGSTSTVSKEKLKFVTTTTEPTFSGEVDKLYAVSSVDINGHESAPAGKGYESAPTIPKDPEPSVPVINPPSSIDFVKGFGGT